MRPRLVLSLVFMATLAACTQITLVQPQRQPIAGSYSVAPSVAWNKIDTTGGLSASGPVIWTRDGTGLQAINFFSVADGERLARGATSAQTEKLPVFRKTMTPLDIKDLIESTLAHREFADFSTSNLRAAKFGSAEGFGMDIAFAGKSGLKRKAIAAGAIVDGRLLMILYEGAALYYFDRDRAEAERIINSVELLKRS